MPQSAVPLTRAETLTHKISNRTAKVGIVGLGYVGLLLAVEFAKAGASALARNDPTLLAKSDPPPPAVGWRFARGQGRFFAAWQML